MFSKIFGSRIKTLRQYYGMSYSEFADELDVSSYELKCWENGGKLIDTENILRICRVFGVEWSYFDPSIDDIDKYFVSGLGHIKSRVRLLNLPVTNNKIFGRDQTIKEIDEAWYNENINILGLVAWGGSGKSAVVNHWIRKIFNSDYNGAEGVYAWNFQLNTNVKQFLHSILKWFGYKKKNMSKSQQVEKLLSLLQKHRIILVMDGIEFLQYPTGPLEGTIKDQNLSFLLREIANNNQGLCIFSSRISVRDLNNYNGFSFVEILLGGLQNQDGIDLVKSYGIYGNDQVIDDVVGRLKGHCLSLKVISEYYNLSRNIKRFSEIEISENKIFLRFPEITKMIESYERWLEGTLCIKLLKLLSFFEEPISFYELKSLKFPIKRLFNEDIDEITLMQSVAQLNRLSLVSRFTRNSKTFVDANFLFRRYFREKIKSVDPENYYSIRNAVLSKEIIV